MFLRDSVSKSLVMLGTNQEVTLLPVNVTGSFPELWSARVY